MKSLSASPPAAVPARILWTSSLDIQPSQFDYFLGDWQLIRTPYSYELSKYQTELIASRLNEYREDRYGVQVPKTGAVTAPPAVRHFIVHPGVTATNIFSSIGLILKWLMLLAFYIVR